MKLTEPQIKKLYTFTQQHYVDWYDVQTELVDHLANGIEAKLENNPNITFEAALNSEFKKFGIMGFNDVIEEKTKALNKHYRKLVWKYFLGFFKLPKIILTLFLIWSYYLGLQHLENRFIIIIPTFIVLLAVPIHFFIAQSKRIKSIKKSTDKKWLFDATVIQLGGLIHFLNIGIYSSIVFDFDAVWLYTMNAVFATVVVLFALSLYISIYVVSPRLRKDMAKQHPEYKFV